MEMMTQEKYLMYDDLSREFPVIVGWRWRLTEGWTDNTYLRTIAWTLCLTKDQTRPFAYLVASIFLQFLDTEVFQMIYIYSTVHCKRMFFPSWYHWNVQSWTESDMSY